MGHHFTCLCFELYWILHLGGRFTHILCYYILFIQLQVKILDPELNDYGSDASTDTKGSRNPETEEDLHHGHMSRLNCSLSRGRQLRRWLAAPDSHT